MSYSDEADRQRRERVYGEIAHRQVVMETASACIVCGSDKKPSSKTCGDKACVRIVSLRTRALNDKAERFRRALPKGTRTAAEWAADADSIPAELKEMQGW